MKFRLSKYIAGFVLWIAMIISFFAEATDIQFYNFAYISWTDSIWFNWEIDWKIYRVFVDTWEILLITWSDWRKYHCWPIKWTWYTERMGEVYFNYWSDLYGDYIWSYICNDWKRRWKAKIEVWGWIEFDDTTFSWPVLNNFYSENYFFHSADWNWNGTWYWFTDGIGLWVWDIVKNAWNSRDEIFAYIDINKSFVQLTWLVSDLQTKGQLKIDFFDLNGNPINGMNFNLKFISDWNYFYHNNSSALFFEKSNTGELNNIKLVDNSLVENILWFKCWSWTFVLQAYFITGNITFSTGSIVTCPFKLNLTVVDWDGDWVIYIWWSEKASLSTSNISPSVSSLSFNGLKWQYLANYNYDFINWWNLYGLGNYDVKIYPSTSYVDQSIWVYYIWSGNYDINNGSLTFTNVEFNYVSSNLENFEAKNIINSRKVEKICQNIKWDWLSLCNLWVRFLNDLGYSVVGLGIDNFSIDDANKNLNISQPYKTFDIDETDWNYTQGLFLDDWTNSLSASGYFNFNIISYKPVVNWAISGQIQFSDGQNVSFSFTGINLEKSMDIYFSWATLDNGVAIGFDNKVEVVYEKLVSNIWNGDFYLSWKLIWCIDCQFLTWWIITWEIQSTEDIVTKQATIYISGADIPDEISYYDIYYSYSLNWKFWNKTIVLKPNIALNWTDLLVDWQVFGFLQFGVALSKAIWSYKPERIAFIWKWDIFSNNVFWLVKEYMTKYKWEKFNSYEDWDLDNVSSLDNYLWYFQCPNKEILYLWDWTNIFINWYNEIVLLNCNLVVKSNILKSNKTDKLIIKQINYPYQFINFDVYQWWKNTTNIYVSSNVDTIMWEIITNWSLFFLSGSDVMQSNIFFPNRRLQPSLKRQIYIKWKIKSVNTIWWGFAIDWKVMFPWGRVEDRDITWFFGDSNLKAADVARGYDINFARASIVDFGSSSYDTWLVSEVILNKYRCVWDKDIDPQPCWMPVVVEYDK